MDLKSKFLGTLPLIKHPSYVLPFQKKELTFRHNQCRKCPQLPIERGLIQKTFNYLGRKQLQRPTFFQHIKDGRRKAGRTSGVSQDKAVGEGFRLSKCISEPLAGFLPKQCEYCKEIDVLVKSWSIKKSVWLVQPNESRLIASSQIMIWLKKQYHAAITLTFIKIQVKCETKDC